MDCVKNGIFETAWKGEESSIFFTSVARNSHLNNKPEAEGHFASSLHQRWKKSNDEIEVNTYESNSGPPAQKTAH